MEQLQSQISNLPDYAAQIRKDICKQHKCEHIPVDVFDPCARCPNGHWGYYLANCSENHNEEAPHIISNALQATGRIIWATATGSKVIVDAKEQERRLDICKMCEFYTGTKCKKCGCFINFKVRLATEHCPINKW